jgi:hypothetical protein
MNMPEMRAVTVGAVRSHLRTLVKDPALACGEDVARALDGVARANPGTVAATFHLHASDNQYRLFMRDFRRWQRNQIRRS